MTGTGVGSVLAGEDTSVYITQNSDFVLYATSGDGSAENPYYLSDNWATYGEASVHIENTDVYVLIDNAYLNGTGYYGIYLKNVSNLNVTNTIIVDKKAAIFIDNCSRVLIDNVVIENDDINDYGIKIDVSDNVAVDNCNILKAKYGLILLNSFRVRIADNIFINSGISFYSTCQVSTGVLITGNTANGRPIGYLYGMANARYDISAYGQIILVNCVNITLYNGNIYHTTIGVQFIFSQNCIIALSNITDNLIGIAIYESSYCRIYGNNIERNWVGLTGSFSLGTIVDENNFIENIRGIWVGTGVSASVIYSNNFIGNILENARDDGTIQDSKLVWISARFMNSVSGYPLSNVSITIEKDGRTYTGYSNEYGLFKVPLPSLGAYNFTISKFRYHTETYTDYSVNTYGIHYYNIALDKRNLGPGTGYVLARFMNETTPVEGATVKVYSYLDGAYYFHSQYVSASGAYAGWVNITGLYYDDYYFVITHPLYEERIIHQIVTTDGYVGMYNNIQLEAYPTDAFIYGRVYDETTEFPLENVSIILYNGPDIIVASIFTDANGFFNVTDLTFGSYVAIVSLQEKYEDKVYRFVIETGGNQPFNPVSIYMILSDYVPEDIGDSFVNEWDNRVTGNYWDDYDGLTTSIVLASDGVYNIPGDNPDNPIDQYPLLEPFVKKTDTVIPTTTVVTITTTETYVYPKLDYTILFIFCSTILVFVVFVIYNRYKM